jgi:hypothetical protein
VRWVVAQLVDVGDEQQVGVRKRKVQIRRERELVEVRNLLSTVPGRGFLYRLLDQCGVFHPSSYYSEIDLSRQAGMRDTGLWVIGEIEAADKDGFIKIIREKQKREETP